MKIRDAVLVLSATTLSAGCAANTDEGDLDAPQDLSFFPAGYSTYLTAPRTIDAGKKSEKTIRVWVLRITIVNTGVESALVGGTHFTLREDNGAIISEYVDVGTRYRAVAPGGMMVVEFNLGHEAMLGTSLPPFNVSVDVGEAA